MAEEKKYLAMTPRLKAQAEALWASGEFKSTAEVAKHLGVAPSATKFLKQAEKGAKVGKVKEAVEDAIANAAAEEARLLKERQRETKDEHYKMASALAKLTWKEVLNANAAGVPFATIAANVKALEIAITALKKVREERFAVLGLNDENVGDDDTMPELVISELSEDQVRELREAQEEEDFLEMPEVEMEDEGVVDTTNDENDEIVEE